MSNRLAERGIQPGEVVILLGRHSIEAAVAMLGCLHRGVVLAPLPPMFNETQLVGARSSRRRRPRSSASAATRRSPSAARWPGDRLLLLTLLPEDVDAFAAQDLPADRTPRHADDLALVLHSSGTTSAPKGIAHSSNTLRYATEGVCARWGLTGEDIYLTVVEFGFVGGLVFGYLPVLLNGATGVLLSRWKPEEALRLIEEHRLHVRPRDADARRGHDPRGQRDDRDLSSMRVLAGPGLTPERRLAMTRGVRHPAARRLRALGGPRPRRPCARRPRGEDPAHRGPPLRRHGDPHRRRRRASRCRSGEVGSVIVNGPSRFLGFLNNDDLTRESLTDWGGYRTGDLGSLDEDGHFIYVGRSKDIIRRGGVTIVPAEVEPVILRHPAVQEVAIVPLPDDRLGERACAAIIAARGHTAPTLAELQEFLDAEGVAKYTWPESVQAFEDFPRTPSLKVVKRDVVKLILERSQVTA